MHRTCYAKHVLKFNWAAARRDARDFALLFSLPQSLRKSIHGELDQFYFNLCHACCNENGARFFTPGNFSCSWCVTKQSDTFLGKLPSVTRPYLSFVASLFQPLAQFSSSHPIPYSSGLIAEYLAMCNLFQFKFNRTLETTIYEVHLWYTCTASQTALRLLSSVQTKREKPRNFQFVSGFFEILSNTIIKRSTLR